MDVTADAIMEGRRVSVVLEPDTAAVTFQNQLPSYVEAYTLPHLFAADRTVWGATRRSHGLADDAGDLVSHLGFIYTNDLPVYVIYNAIDDPSDTRSSTANIKINGASQYRRLDFIGRPSGARVWHSGAPSATDALDRSIRSGNAHYIAYREASGAVRSHPLDLVFLFHETGLAEFRLESAVLPTIMKDPPGFSKQLRTLFPGIDAPETQSAFNHKGSLNAFNTFRIIGTPTPGRPDAAHFIDWSELEEVAVFAAP